MNQSVIGTIVVGGWQSPVCLFCCRCRRNRNIIMMQKSGLNILCGNSDLKQRGRECFSKTIEDSRKYALHMSEIGIPVLNTEMLHFRKYTTLIYQLQ